MRKFPHLTATLAAHRLFANAPNDSEAWAVLKSQFDLDLVVSLYGPIVRTVVAFGDGCFEYDTFGEVAFVMALLGEDAETVTDLVAWSAREPDMFEAMFGASVLGLDRLANPASYCDGPCCLYSTPLAWLKARCEGAVVLDYDKARQPLQAAPGLLTADSLELGESLLRSGIVSGKKLVVPSNWRRMAA